MGVFGGARRGYCRSDGIGPEARPSTLPWELESPRGHHGSVFSLFVFLDGRNWSELVCWREGSPREELGVAPLSGRAWVGGRGGLAGMEGLRMRVWGRWGPPVGILLAPRTWPSSGGSPRE